MKKLVFLLLIYFPCIAFAQKSTIVAPVGFLREEPAITAAIVFKIEENEQVQVLERVNKNWLKVQYRHKNRLLTGYITNHTLGEAPPRRKRLMAGN